MAHDLPVVPAAGLQQGHPGAVPLLAHSGAGLRRAGSQDRKASRWTRAGRPVTSRSPSAPQTRHRAPARIPGRAAHRHRRCRGLCLARGDLCQPLHHRASDHRYGLERPALFWSPDRQGGPRFHRMQPVRRRGRSTGGILLGIQEPGHGGPPWHNVRATNPRLPLHGGERRS